MRKLTDKQKAKLISYAGRLSAQVVEVFGEDCENHIDAKELRDDSESLTLFTHALANMMTTVVFNELTGHEKNYLEFNHMANHLVMQYQDLHSKEVEDEE